MAGPTVGHIEVTVDADTGKLKAQLLAAGKEAGKGAADQIDSELGEVDGRQLKAKIAQIKKQIEQQLKNIDVDLDVEADTADIKGVRAQIEKGLTGIEAEVDVQVDKGSKAKADALIQGNFEKLGKDSGEGFASKLWGSISGRMKLIAGLIVELVQPAAVLLQGLASVVTQVLGSAFQALGGTIGAVAPLLFGLSFGLGAVVVGSKNVVKAFGAIASEWQAAADAGRAMNLESEEMQAALKKLGPAAKDTVIAFGGLLDQLDTIQKTVQEALFAGMGDVLRDLAKNVIPDVGAALVIAAGQANTFGKDLAAALKTIDFSGLVGGLTPAMASLSDAIATVVQTIQPFILAATPAATRLAEMLKLSAESLLRMVQAGQESGALNSFLQNGLTALSQWWDLLKNIGSTLFTIFEAGASGGTGMVSRLSEIVGQFNAWLNTTEGQAALLNFFETGREILSSLTPLLKGAVGFFQNLVSPDAISAVASLAKNLGEFLPVLGQLVNISGQVSIIQLLAQLLNQVGQAIQPLIEPLTTIARIIGDSLSRALLELQPLLNAAGRLLGRLFDAIAPLMPIIGDLFVRGVELLADAFAQLEPVLQPVVDALGKELASALPQVAATFNELFAAMAPLVPLFIDLAMEALPALLPLLPLFLQSGLRLVTLGAELLTAFAPLIELFLKVATAYTSVMAPVWEAFTKALVFVITAVTGFVNTVIGWFKTLFNVLVGNSIIPDLINAIVSWFTRLPGMVMSAIVGMLGQLVGFFVDVGVSVVSTVAGFIVEIVSTFASLPGQAVGALASLGSSLLGVITSAMASMLSGVTSGIATLVGAFLGLGGKIVSAVSGSLGQMFDLGQTIVEQIISGIGSIGGQIASKIKSFIPSPGDIVSGIGSGISKLNPFDAEGGVYASPTPKIIGEAGREAVIPLDRPLSLVDPSVRAMAALLRGQTLPTQGASSGAAIGKQVNVYQTITPVSADPVAVAAQVINRAAAMAS